MDLLESLQTLAARAHQQAGHLQTEEAVKTALVLPFLMALGYDVFDPAQVTSGPQGDAGLPLRPRVDLLLRAQGAPLLLLECLPFGQPLGDPATAHLYWTFPAAGVRLGVLTNGTCYRFFTDLDQPGTLEDQPYFEFNVLAFQDRDLDTLRHYACGALDVDALLASMAEARMARRVTRVVAEQVTQPSPEFLQTLATLAQAGPLAGEAQMAAFGRLVRQAFQHLAAGPAEAPRTPAPVAAILAPEDEPLAAGPPEALAMADETPAIPVPTVIQAEAPPSSRSRVWPLAMGLVLVGTGGFAWARLRHPAPRTAPFQIQVDPPAAPEPPAPVAQAEAAPAPEPPPAALPEAAPAVPLAAAVAQGRLEDAARLSEGRAKALAPDHWTLRLAIAHEPPTVRNLLTALRGQADAVFLRPIRMRDGRDCYQVFLGDFQDEASARLAVAQLPASVLEDGKPPRLFRAAMIPARQE